MLCPKNYQMFFDLVFVVAIDQLARRPQHNVTGHETLVYLALYGPICVG